MKKKIFNRKMIVSVEVYGQERSNYIWLNKTHNIFGKLKRESGYHKLHEGLYGIEMVTSPLNPKYQKIPNNMYQIDDRLYYKPRLKVNYPDGSTYNIYFNTEEEMDAYVKVNFTSALWEHKTQEELNA